MDARGILRSFGLYREFYENSTVKSNSRVVTVATHVADRLWKAYQTGKRDERRDLDGQPITAGEARALIAAHWTVPERVRRRTKKGAPRIRTGRPEGPQIAGDAPESNVS